MTTTRTGRSTSRRLTLVRYDATAGNLDLMEVHFPAGTPGAQNVVVSTSNFCSLAGTNLVPSNSNTQTRHLVGGVSQFSVWTDRSGVPSKTAQIFFTVARTDGSQAFHAVMTPRSPMWSLMP